jgi:hypothetical protein
MKTKLVLFLIATLVIALFFSLFFARQSLKTITFPQVNEQVTTDIVPLPAERMPLSRTPAKRAITIVGTSSKKTEAQPAILGEAMTGAESPVPKAGAASLHQEQGTSTEPVSGVTKINKKPTPAEKEEMQSKGIIIF